ncbi:hypothetical protein E4U39_006526 [Claviceps sp. Clav50 group G5]|nr:hypothetical protein E4U39_006526 [Claviceps sp. Clav50 group G5]
MRDVLFHLPDPNQWIALNSRMDATERDVTELRETTTTMNTNIHSINDTLTAITNQLQQMRQDFTDLNDRLTTMDLRIDARFNRIDARFNQIDARFNQVNSDLTTMAEDNNTRFTHTDSQLVELRTLMESQFQGVDRHFADQNIRMDALHKNAMSRLDNRLPGASSDDLEPLFNLKTGQRIQDKPTRSGLDRMRSAALENYLRALEIIPEGSEDEKRDQLKQAYGARAILYFGS